MVFLTKPIKDCIILRRMYVMDQIPTYKIMKQWIYL